MDAGGFLPEGNEFENAVFLHNNPKIDWGIFDHIYCIHFKPYEKRYEEIKETLSKVGIFGRDNFSFWYTEPNPEYDRLYQKMLSEKKIFDWNETRKCGDFGNSKIFNLAMNSYRMLQDAYDKGYGRILVCEDDIVFLKDKRLLAEYMRNFPEELDVVNMDYWLLPLDRGKTHKKILKSHSVNKYYSETTGLVENVNASLISLSRNAVRHVLDNLRKKFKVADYYTSWHPDVPVKDEIRFGISNTNLAVQRVLDGANNCQSFHANNWRYSKSHHLDLYMYDTYEKSEILPLKKRISREFPRMRIALVTIARDEDNYIDEWVDYNLLIGFDDIFIYQNGGWKCNLKKKYPNVHLLDGDIFDLTKVGQDNFYNHFKDTYGKEYDWVAFIDVDEFLNIVDESYDHNIKLFLNDYSDKDSVSIYWKLFGTSDLKKVKDDDFSCINRFTKCQSHLNVITKTIYNFSRLMK